MYSEEQLNRLLSESRHYYGRCYELQETLIHLAAMEQDEAKEHLIYGVARRLGIIRECLRFFFDAVPPDAKSEPDRQVRFQANSHLHSFLINCAGIGDNIAWYIAHKKEIGSLDELEKRKLEIGLFKKSFEVHIPAALLAKVRSFDKWNAHITSFRHPVAHRIPPYLIPYCQIEGTGEIDYTPRYIHAFDKSHPVPLHAQCICDVGAVVELVEALVSDIQGGISSS